MAEKRRARRKQSRSEWAILVVQASIGAVILLLALTARLIGGEVYEQLGEAFYRAVTQDAVVSDPSDPTTQTTAPSGALSVKFYA